MAIQNEIIITKELSIRTQRSNNTRDEADTYLLLYYSTVFSGDMLYFSHR